MLYLTDFQEKIVHRRKAAIILISILFGLLFYKFIQLQIISRDKYVRRSEQNRVREIIEYPPRGLIYDRNGRLIVDNRPAFSVYIVPYEVMQSSQVLSFFTKNLSMSGSELEKKMIGAGLGFHPVKVKSHADFSEISLIEESKLELPGVLYGTEPKRFYPGPARASHILGYIKEIDEHEIELLGSEKYDSGDIVGKQGIERYYEHDLYGEKGYRYMQVDAFGREIAQSIPSRMNHPPEAGLNLYLSIDVELQALAEQLLEGKKGSVVMMDPRNGEILVMTSKPDYEPGIFSQHISTADWKKLSEDPNDILLNRATSGNYPAGSTFKLVSVIAGINEKIITPDWSCVCNGTYILGRGKFDCYKQTAHGKLNLLEAIERSCNVYFYNLAREIGFDVWCKYTKLFHFGEKTEIDIPEESYGLVPTTEYMDKKYGKDQWTVGNLLNLVIGQGDILVTPLQMAVFTSVIANGGIYYQPRIVKYREDPKTHELSDYPIVGNAIPGIEPETYRIVKQGMVLVVEGEHGTGRGCRLPNVRIAGKTGTAENPHGEDHAWFIGFAPVNNPTVAFAILVENGGTGSKSAVPIARELLQKLFPTDKYMVHRNALLSSR